LCAHKTFSGLLVAYVIGYQGIHAVTAEIEEAVAKPCQALSSVFC